MRWLFLLLALSGCPDKQDPQLLVEIDGRSAVTVRDYQRAVARLRLEREGDEAGPLPRELHQLVLDQLIEQRVLALEAQRLGVKASTTAVANEVEAMKRALPPHRFERFLAETYQTEEDLERAIAERVTSSLVMAREAKVEVAEEELKQAFEKLPEKIRPARARCAQIMVPTEDAAAPIVKKLKVKDADFAAIAREHSIAPEAKQGGDLGWFQKGDMPAVFDQVCFALEPGQISELTPSELGYHVFKGIAREEERPLTFEEAKDDLAEELRSNRQREKEREVMQSLLSQHRVERHEKRIADAIK